MESAKVTRSALKICFENNVHAFIQNRLNLGENKVQNRLNESSVNVKMEAECMSQKYLAV